MSLHDEHQESKYKAILVAYKDLTDEVKKELNFHFISVINELSDLKSGQGCGEYRTSAGLAYRTCIYHKWFRDKIIEMLDKGYTLGIVEIHVSDYYKQEDIIKEMDIEYKENILVVDEAEI